MSAIEYKSEKFRANKGTVIAMQGSILKEILFLNEGTIEVTRCQENIKGYLADEIISKSIRIELITGPSIFAIENIITGTDIKYSYTALSDCEITKYIIPSGDFIKFFKNTPQIAMNVLLTMKEGCVRNINNLKNFSVLFGELEKVIDNLQLFKAIVDSDTQNPLLDSFINNGGVIPSKIDTPFLLANNSTIFGKTYGNPGFDPKTKYQWKKLEFIHNLLKSRPDSFIQIISTQIQVFTYIYSELSFILNQLSSDIGKMALKLKDRMDVFFLDKFSILNLILDNGENILRSDKVSPSISKAIIAISRNIDHAYKKISGREHTQIFPKLDRFSKINLNKNQTNEENTYKSVHKSKLLGSTQIILSFSGLPNLEIDRIKGNIKKFDQINFKEPSEKESRKIIKDLQADFFKLFSILVFNAFSDYSVLPLPVKLFLHFGFIDESILTDEEIDGLCDSLPQFESLSGLEYPIITLLDYLHLIYKEEECPGLSINGEDYSKLLRKNNSRNPIDDSPKGKVMFEIENMIKEGMRITSDNPRAYIPYLSSNSFKGTVDYLMNTPKKLETYIKKINDVDPSLFFRELAWKITGHSELIRKEVKPYMILVPGSGIRVQLWQEIVNNSRNSKARIIVPIIFNGSLDKALIHTFANFRWELNKLIAGASWMDPVEGGFVGAFYDFSQYYNKAAELSLDAKEEIKLLFNKIKIDRDRFAYFYERWCNYEKDGVAKLNKLVRTIFYRYIPFPLEIREQIRNLPLYEHLDTKYNNIKRREIKSLESRYHKYAQPDGSLPEDLQAYIDILRR